MTLIRNAVEALTKKVDRLPIQGTRTSLTSFGVGALGTAPALSQMSSSGWLFAVIDKISTSVAAVDWQVVQTNAKGERTRVEGHPLQRLWNAPNPFYTREEFVEASEQHFELTGEMWWVILRNSRGEPEELWVIQPDRIRPVPDEHNFIRGYLYTVGNEKIPLAKEDVIFIRRPSPIDPYRGIGTVGSILLELDTEKAAAEWTRQFFRNSAEPGGVIEFDTELSDADFERISTRWRQQHQGTPNAHRVAIIERGKWTARRVSQREMEFSQLRRLGRELILGAYGVPASVMGITENVNRANAEAGEYSFSIGTIRPRLRRIRGALNLYLAPMFAADLRFEFVDPTPKNRELDLNKSERGFNAGILTLNEAREVLGLDEISDGGDDFKPVAPAPAPFAMMAPTAPQRALAATITKIDPLLPAEIEAEEAKILEAWRRRLRAQAEAIGEYIEQFFKDYSGFLIAESPVALFKLEPSDLDGYDWDWWTRYSDDVVDELTSLFRTAITAVAPDLEPTLAMRLASEYATRRGGELLGVEGPANLVATTRARVGVLVSNAIDEGQSLGQLQKNLRTDFQFSRERAVLVSRTETATAQGTGAMDAAKIDGRDEKQWVTQADEAVDADCRANAAQSWIVIGDRFASGTQTVPAHPQCRCVVIYRTAEIQEGMPTPGDPSPMRLRAGGPFEFRCPGCDKLLSKNAFAGQPVWCGRCKGEQIAVPLPNL